MKTYKGFALYDKSHITWLLVLACAAAAVLIAGRKGGKLRENLKTGTVLAALTGQLIVGGPACWTELTGSIRCRSTSAHLPATGAFCTDSRL